jgi:DamX protein
MVVRQLIALPSQLQLIDRLQHHIYLSSSLIFVAGEQGAGKTTLLEQLANKLPGNIREAFIQLNEQLSDAQIRQQILVQLYEDPLFDAQDSLFSSISLLEEKQSYDASRLIIFDNANYLSAELLLELAELIVQKAFFGENEINILLLADEDSCRQMLASACQIAACLEFKLEPLSRDESNSLLNHIFRQAGYQYQIQNQDAVAKQLRVCAGVPQKIITLAEQIIAGKLVSNESSWLKARLPAVLLMILLLSVAGGLAAYLYPMFITPVKSVAEIKETQEKLFAADKIVAQTNNVNDVKPEQISAVMVEELAGSWKKEPLSEIKENRLQVGISDPDVQEKKSNLSLPEKVDNMLEDDTENLIEEEVIVELKQPAVESEQEKFVEQEQDTANSVTEDEVAMREEEVKAELPMKSEEQLSVEKKADSIFTARADLLSVSPSHYTLQLSAMATQESLQKFIVEHGLPKENVHIYQTTHNNNPWYVVIFGDYESWSAAKNASKALPGSLANIESWIKKYQLVHQDLQLNNE